MESLIFFRKHLAMNGIILQQSSKKFHLKNLTVIILCFLYGISLAKLLDEVNNFDEYVDIVNRMITTYLFNLYYMHIVWKTPQLYGFIDNLENCIRKSKWHLTWFNHIVLNSLSFNLEIDHRIKNSFDGKFAHFFMSTWLATVRLYCNCTLSLFSLNSQF